MAPTIAALKFTARNQLTAPAGTELALTSQFGNNSRAPCAATPASIKRTDTTAKIAKTTSLALLRPTVTISIHDTTGRNHVQAQHMHANINAWAAPLALRLRSAAPRSKSAELAAVTLAATSS